MIYYTVPPTTSLSLLNHRKIEEHVVDSLLEQPTQEIDSPSRTVSEPKKGGNLLFWTSMQHPECVYIVCLIVLVITNCVVYLGYIWDCVKWNQVQISQGVKQCLMDKRACTPNFCFSLLLATFFSDTVLRNVSVAAEPCLSLSGPQLTFYMH